MINKFLETIRKNQMLKKGEGVVIGVSGGPDSLCLLHLFWRIQKEFDLKLYALHLNHQFRGTEAKEDAEYVKEFCKNLEIDSFIYSKDVSQYSKNRGITFEEGGRELRYQLFYEIMKKTGASKIAVGQNMDDQAETVMMRLIRGSGIDGLSAIEYIRDHKIIRPLLDISRKEIENYCEVYGLNPRMDKTNLESIYTRNRVRLELLPYIEEHFNPNIKSTLCRMANLLREDKDYINKQVDEIYPRIAKKMKEEVRIDIDYFRKYENAIQKRILRKAISSILGDLKNIENQHMEKLMNLIDKGQVGGTINLPKEIIGILDYKTLILQKKKNIIEKQNFEYNMNVGDSLVIKELEAHISSYIIPIENTEKIPNENDKKYFDIDKIQKEITIRNRRSGDKFSPLGMKGSKKLKDYFIDEKIPRKIRDQIPLVCDGNEIIWIIGYRVSEKYKIDENTKKVLVLNYQKSKCNEEE